MVDGESCQEIEFDVPFLPPEATIEEVLSEIESWKVINNERIISSHSVFVKEGTASIQIARCLDIVNEFTGEFHHYAIDIYNVRRFNKKGYVLTDIYRIESLEQLYALQEFLTLVREGQLGHQTRRRILVDKDDYLKFEKLNEDGKISIIESIISQSDGIEKIVEKGGQDFLTKAVKWFIKNQGSESLAEVFQGLFSVVDGLDGEERLKFIEAVKNQNLSKEDLDIISGRKDGLFEFEQRLSENSEWTEPQWQDFFERNTWIFGYGLDYRFLKILQREAHISRTDLDGRNDVIGDFLTACSNFTVLIELKKPNTNLFTQTQNRADSWKLSTALVDAVSQILAQKANWTIQAESENFNSAGELITQKTYDPKTILIIGHTNQFTGRDKTSQIKKKTFELFRRNLRNIDIITYDELLDRAKFIVKPIPF
jgi:hypothetical protein